MLFVLGCGACARPRNQEGENRRRINGTDLVDVQLLTLLRAGRFEIAISVPLAFQYESVLVRHAKELALLRQEAIGLVDYFCQIAHKQEIHFLWRPTLCDPGDEFVLELAVAAGCRYIVTHNVKDFSGADRFRVSIVTPGTFLRLLERKQ